METEDRDLVGEAVRERSGEETEAVVAVEEVEFIFLTEKWARRVGIPETETKRLEVGGVSDW